MKIKMKATTTLTHYNGVTIHTIWSLLLLTVVLSTLSFAQNSRQTNRDVADRQAKSADGEYTIFTKPLDRNDPRAQVPEELRNVQPKPVPVIRKTADAEALPADPEALGTLEYNVTTGQITRQSADSNAIPEFVKTMLEKGKNSLPGSFGANLQVDFSDKQKGTAQTETIVGTDDRVRVTPTTSSPWRAMTKLYFTAPDGYKWQCSGVMVGARHVLTAGHCVYDSEHGGYTKSASVVPAADMVNFGEGPEEYWPYGNHAVTKMRVFLGWILYDGLPQQWDHDMALLTLADPIGNTTGWLGMKALTDSEFGNASLNLRTAGYPRDKWLGKCLYRATTGPGMFDLLGPGKYQIETRLDTAEGQSGSPLYFTDGNTQNVVGVLSHDLEPPYLPSYFTRLHSAKLQVILNWMAAD